MRNEGDNYSHSNGDSDATVITTHEYEMKNGTPMDESGGSPRVGRGGGSGVVSRDKLGKEALLTLDIIENKPEIC